MPRHYNQPPYGDYRDKIDRLQTSWGEVAHPQALEGPQSKGPLATRADACDWYNGSCPGASVLGSRFCSYHRRVNVANLRVIADGWQPPQKVP